MAITTYISKVCVSLYGCYVVTMLVCRLVSMVVWCALLYGCAMSMCLCLCVVSLYVCALCHVLVVYVSVLEWLGLSVLSLVALSLLVAHLGVS